MSTIPPTGAVPDVVTNTLIATDWGNAIGAASRGRVVQRFNSLAERDASITAPVAGMLCYVLATDLFYGYRTASGWTTLIGGPRDTMHARVYRNAAISFPPAGGAIPWDGIAFDAQGMYSTGAWAFVVPAAGMWVASVTVAAAPTAAGQALWAQLFHQGPGCGQSTSHSGSTWGLSATATTTVRCAAGDTVQAGGASPAMAAQLGTTATFFSIDYLGAG